MIKFILRGTFCNLAFGFFNGLSVSVEYIAQTSTSVYLNINSKLKDKHTTIYNLRA